jgi:hypothetical protein
MALTTSQLFQGTWGGRNLECWSITGDGSTTTFDTRCACVDHAWIQSSTGSSTANHVKISISSSVITMTHRVGGAALESAKIFWLFFLGST